MAYSDRDSLEMHRARIPNVLFKDIVGDIEIVMKQYGPPMDHKNEEGSNVQISCSSRCLNTVP